MQPKLPTAKALAWAIGLFAEPGRPFEVSLGGVPVSISAETAAPLTPGVTTRFVTRCGDVEGAPLSSALGAAVQALWMVNPRVGLAEDLAMRAH